MEVEGAGHTRKEVNGRTEACHPLHQYQVLFQTEVRANQRGIGTCLVVGHLHVKEVEGVGHHILVPTEGALGNLPATGKVGTLKGLVQAVVTDVEDQDLTLAAVEKVHTIPHPTPPDKADILVDLCLAPAVEIDIFDDPDHGLLDVNHVLLGVGPDLSPPAEIKSIVNPVPEVIPGVEVQEFLQDDQGPDHCHLKGQNCQRIQKVGSRRMLVHLMKSFKPL